MVRLYNSYVESGDGSLATDFGLYAEDATTTVEVYNSHVAAFTYLATNNDGAQVLMLNGLVEGTQAQSATECVTVRRTDTGSAGWGLTNADCSPNP